MQFSERWLRTLVDPPIDTAALCDKLTMTGFEVEDVAPAAPAFANVVVGRITNVAPHPDAARLFESFLFSAEGQQLLVDIGAMRSWHAQVKERAGRVPMGSIKLLKEDPAGVERSIEEVKKRYTSYFKT